MKAQIISFHCTLKDPLGQVISSSFNQEILTEITDEAGSALNGSLRGAQGLAPSLSGHTAFDHPLQGLIEGLQGLKKGERRRILVSADRAYGYYDPNLVMKVTRKKFPRGGELEVGFQVITQTEDGESKVFRIIGADALTITLDGNHPLAGQDLCFDIEATATRDATPQEIAQTREPLLPDSMLH